MPRKRNLRLETYNKLRMIKKSNSKDVTKLQLEELEGIIDNVDFQNILFLRKCIKSGNPLDYFNEDFNNKEKIQPTKLFLNKEEYNKLCEVLSLNERRNDEEKSTRATELKEKLVKYASVLDKREQDTEEKAIVSLFPIEIKFLLNQLLDFVNYMPSRDYFEELREETFKRKQNKEE